MISLFIFLFSTVFYTLIFGAILTQLLKKQIAVATRTATYFGVEEGSIENENSASTTNAKKNKIDLPILDKVNEKVKTMIDQQTSETKKKKIAERLREAGYSLKTNPIDFRFFQLLIGVTLFLIVNLLLGQIDTNVLSRYLLAIIFAVLGMYYPSFYLSVIIKKRRFAIQKTMPDFFDTANLSIEAGLGLDASLLKVCNQMKGPLSDEFLQTLEEMKLGKSRREAFADLRNRVPVHQFQSIITSLIQADILGVGMVKVLRSLTERIREQRIQLAREQAMKAPVKMVFPMLLFIFPAMFIVMLGPLIVLLVKSVF